MVRTVRTFLVASAALALLFLAGCGGQSDSSSLEVRSSGSSTSTKAAEGEHAHKPSAHGGIIVAIGRDNYHAEAVFEKDGVLRFYTLGNDEAKVIEIEAKPLTAYAKAEGGAEAASFVLEPVPQAGDREGQGVSSQGNRRLTAASQALKCLKRPAGNRSL